MKKNAIFDILYGDKLWLDPASELQFLPTDAAARLTLGLCDSVQDNETFNVCGRGVVRLGDVMSWAGREVAVAPGSPRVRYDVGIAKLQSVLEVPDTSTSVAQFVRESTR